MFRRKITKYNSCEDSLTDKAYFDAAYSEAIQLTAYLCKLYGINPLGTVDGIPTILCHQDSYQYGMGSNHGDVYNWFNRYGKTMDNVRADVSALVGHISLPSTPSGGTSAARPMLRLGDKGSYVKELQSGLIKLGYSLPKYGADGDFGNETLAAVKKFQADRGLEVDGVVGQNTWGAIDKAISAASQTDQSTTQPATGSQAIKAGDIVSIREGAVYYTGKSVPAWVRAKTWVVQSVYGSRIVINKSSDGKNSINSPIDVKYLSRVSTSSGNTSGTTSPAMPISVGDRVSFSGNKHYISASSTLALPCKPGVATVTNICTRANAAHKYHLVAVPGLGATVHGWVNEADVRKA